MAYDGFTVAAVARSCAALAGGRIEKIYQPSKDEILLAIRCKEGTARLMLTVNAEAPHVRLTDAPRENPAQPPVFCMVLRKHLQGGKLTRVEQPGFDRVLRFVIEASDEMGDLAEKSLIIEMMGRHSNIILTDARGFILDSIRRVPHTVSSVREVLPGKPYAPAPDRGKTSPMDTRDYGFPPFATRFNGVSAQWDREILRRAEAQNIPAAAVFAQMLADARDGRFVYEMALGEDGRPKELACYAADSARVQSFETVSALLEAFYRERVANSRVAARTQDLRRLVNANIERCAKKREVLAQTLVDARSRDTLKLYGELIMANLYQLEKGMKRAECANFYDGGNPVSVPLDPRKTPNENAQFYFKQYNKKKRADEAATEQAAKNDAELAYLDTVLASVSACDAEADINDIREELAAQGYIRKRGKTPKAKPSKPLVYAGDDGFTVFVGKNNRQNDELTARAAPDDLWLHTKDIPGSHVLIRLEGAEPPDELIVRAANLAAYYSKAREGSNVPVDYTRRRYVKKPSGAKPGFVIYTNQKTVYVTPAAPQ